MIGQQPRKLMKIASMDRRRVTFFADLDEVINEETSCKARARGEKVFTGYIVRSYDLSSLNNKKM